MESSFRARLTTVMCCILMFLGGYENLSAEEALSAMSVWRDMVAPGSADQPLPPRKPWVIRERPIAFDPQVLTILKDAGARPHPPLTVELFDAAQYQLDIISTLSKFNDSSVIRGVLKGQDRGEITLVVNGTTVGATIKIGQKPFKVEHISNGRHRLLELDPAKLPPE